VEGHGSAPRAPSPEDPGLPVFTGKSWTSEAPRDVTQGLGPPSTWLVLSEGQEGPEGQARHL